MLSKSHRVGVFCVGLQNSPPPIRMGTSHEELRNFKYDQHRIPSPRSELELLMEHLEIWNMITTEYPFPRIVISHGGICVMDWCVETTAISPRGYRSRSIVGEELNSDTSKMDFTIFLQNTWWLVELPKRFNWCRAWMFQHKRWYFLAT